MRYVFAPGRDVVVGYGPGSEIALDHLGNATPPPPARRAEVVLRFTGNQWVAIDRSDSGIFVDGSRASTVEIRDGQAINIGDPLRGPRLVFQIAAPAGPSRQPPGPPPGTAYPPTHSPQSAQAAPPPPFLAAQPGRPEDANLRVPTQRDTQRMRIPPAPLPPPPPAVPAAQPPPAAVTEDDQSKGRGLIERIITRKLRAAPPSFRTREPSLTHRLPVGAGGRTTGVAAYRLGLTVNGNEVLTDISFIARPGTLMAVTGPSAARNSALIGLLAGTRKPSTGRTTVDGHDVYAEPESMRTRIGIVRREECLHRQLTVEQALTYAAELRLPPDTSYRRRHRLVDRVLDELELTPHRATRVNKLPPEVRRCASMAIELVTRPTLLVVEEPGAGLDAAQQSHVMAILRRQAGIGCVVVVAMSSHTSLANLNRCDQVLLLTSTGTMAFLGTPLQLGSAMGTPDWSQVLAQVDANPDEAHRAFRAQPQASASTTPPEVAAPSPPPPGLPLKRQIGLLARREARLLFAGRAFLAFLAVLPFALAALTLLIPGDSGFARPSPGSTNPHEAVEILAALNVAAVITGTTLTIRAMLGERRCLRREQAVGLSTLAYLGAKILVFGLAAAILTAIFFAIVVAAKGEPMHGAVLLRNATVELYVTIAVTAIVSAVIGLALSTLINSLREILLLVVPFILASMLFNGSLVPLVSKWVFQQISWFVPARWGFAASASTVDLRRVDALATNAATWTHYSGWWVFDMTMLVLFGAIAAGVTLYRLLPPDAPDAESATGLTSRTAGTE